MQHSNLHVNNPPGFSHDHVQKQKSANVSTCSSCPCACLLTWIEREGGGERERERERYIYIYIEREREREKKKERKRASERERERERESGPQTWTLLQIMTLCPQHLQGQFILLLLGWRLHEKECQEHRPCEGFGYLTSNQPKENVSRSSSSGQALCFAYLKEWIGLDRCTAGWGANEQSSMLEAGHSARLLAQGSSQQHSHMGELGAVSASGIMATQAVAASCYSLSPSTSDSLPLPPSLRQDEREGERQRDRDRHRERERERERVKEREREREDPHHRYRATFQSVLWSGMQEMPGTLRDSIFQHVTNSRLQGGPSLATDQRCQNVHVGARDVCGAPMTLCHPYACCRKEVGERHNNIARKLRNLCVLAGWRAQCEQSVYIQRPNQEPTMKRADLYTVSGAGEAWALDVRVVSGSGQIRNLLADAERSKMHEYGCVNGYLVHGVRFVPFVLHTSGFLGPMASNFMLALEKAHIHKQVDRGRVWGEAKRNTRSTHMSVLASTLATSDFRIWQQASPAA